MQVKSSWTGVVQGPSPDEVALVDAARTLGYEFVARSRTHVTLRLHGEEVRLYRSLTPTLHPRVHYVAPVCIQPVTASGPVCRQHVQGGFPDRPKAIEREARCQPTY